MINWAEHLPALQVVVPLLCAPLVVLLHPRGLAWAAATAASALALATSISLAAGLLAGHSFQYKMGSWQPPFGIELRVDAFSAILLLIVTGASTVALLAARRSVDSQISTERQPLFYAAWLLALSGLVGILVFADAFNIFVFMEISSLATYVLIAMGPHRRSLLAAYQYLIMGTIGASLYVIGIGLIYLMTGTLNLADIELKIHDVAGQKPIFAAAGFITIGLALKAAVFPLHIWLPNAYTYAPNMVTVFLAACSTKVSLYVLLRLDFVVFQANLTDHNLQFSHFLMPLAVLAMLVASAVAIFENNLKRLFAYSSVAQVGYIMLGASLVNQAGLTASILHMFNHALAKGALFLVAASLAMRFSGLRLSDLSGAGRQMPWTMAAFVIGGLSLIGVPGTAGFISKWYFISAVLNEGTLGIALVAAIVASSLMAVVYIWRVVETAYFKAPQGGAIEMKEAPLSILLVLWVAALANVYFGLATYVPVTLSSMATESLLGHLR